MGVLPSLHSNYHHQIAYAKFNLKIYYPPPYEREIWYYQKANTDQIRKAIEQFSWDRSLKNLDINEMVFLFNRIIKNIISNYIPHEIIICDDRDPPWINNRVKELINEKNNTFQCYLHSNKDLNLFNKVGYLQNELKSLIDTNKEKYYSRISKRMTNPLTSTKTYWSILKSFLNSKKIFCIPPLLHQNRYIPKYKDKAELFNNFFANQCYLINNSSVLPSVTFKRAENKFSSINFSLDDLAKIIQKLNPDKAPGYDMISIRMLKICGSSIYKPLQLIFRSCTENGKFTSEWKKVNVVPIHRKVNKQTLENCRPVSLLPICSKVFERLIYNSFFKQLTANQSGFKPGDSCINQLLSITHEIYKSFDDGYEVRRVFLDIPKAFDKVWHNGHIYKNKME